MSADSKNVPDSFADQLASFDDKLQVTGDNVDMLADIQAGIGRLLASSGNSESEIRRILQERYEAGALRKETFQLVKSAVSTWAEQYRPIWEARFDRMDDYLNTLQNQRETGSNDD